jgi:ligand-binding sensor protein
MEISLASMKATAAAAVARKKAARVCRNEIFVPFINVVQSLAKARKRGRKCQIERLS